MNQYLTFWRRSVGLTTEAAMLSWALLVDALDLKLLGGKPPHHGKVSFSREGLFSWVLSVFAFMLLVLIAYSCAAIIKASVVLFKHLFLTHPTDLHFLYPLLGWSIFHVIVFVYIVLFFHSFSFFLYSFGVSLSSSSSIVHAVINNLSLFFLT